MAPRHYELPLLRPFRALLPPVLFLVLILLQLDPVELRGQGEPQAGPGGTQLETQQCAPEVSSQDSLPPKHAAHNGIAAAVLRHGAIHLWKPRRRKADAGGLDLGQSATCKDQVEALADSPTEASRPASASPLELLPNAPPPANSPSLSQSAADSMRRGDFTAAIQAYKQAQKLDPNDSDLKLGLARALSLSGHSEESKGIYQQVLSKTPDNADALEGLGSAFLRSDQPFEARAVFERLAAKHSANPEFKLDLARVEARLGNYRHARELLTAVLAFHPHEHEARLQLAYVKLYQGRYAAALADFAQLLKADPTDFDALLGNARVHYFRGNIAYSYALVSKLLEDRPNDYDAVFLMANLERARQHPQTALELLARADQLSPGNPETLQLEKTLRQEKAVALHTAASYAREISSGNGSPDLIGFAGQDLRRFVYETAVDFSALPRTRSTVTLDAMPATSAGSFGGAVAPLQITYRQTTPIFSNLTLRAGAGVIRFGPGGLQNIPEQAAAVSAATYRPLAFVSATFAVKKNLNLDLTVARDPIPYTPLSVRMGVMENRVEGGLRYSFASHTDLFLSAYAAEYSSIQFQQLGVMSGNAALVKGGLGRQPARGGSATLVRNVLRLEHASLDLGYAGRAFAFSGSQQQEYMGFFNPSFYQVHQVTARLYGPLRGPLGYDFSGGLGVQQIASNQPFTQALNLTPTLSYKLNRRLSLRLGYTHYNYAQSLGVIRGNGVILSTDSRF
jgi:Flp pilus assembly protein TadD